VSQLICPSHPPASSPPTAPSAAVDHDIGLLVEHIKRVGKQEADGSYTTTFGTLFKDDSVQNSLESLAGTLKAAKRKKIVQVCIHTAHSAQPPDTPCIVQHSTRHARICHLYLSSSLLTRFLVRCRWYGG